MPVSPPNGFPSADSLHPVVLADGSLHQGTVFLKNAIDHPRIDVGDYTYASAHRPPDNWTHQLAPYLYPTSPERLKIGKFCQIADGVTFITSSANHRYDGFSSFPFAIFDDMDPQRPSMPQSSSDTIVGHDVWIGQGACILPGARIGTGVIIGAQSVVSGTVPDYTVVAGNPARVIRLRFETKIIERLLQIQWWNWSIDKIIRHEAAICNRDLDALFEASLEPDDVATL